MKMMAGFIIGIGVTLLAVLAVSYYTTTARADDNSATSPDGTNVSALLPDVGKIYRESLGSPYRQVQPEITDPEIAAYYRTLMDRTGLDKIGEQ